MKDSSATVQNVIQGEFAISDNPRVVMTTVLGSCIAVCLSDPRRGVGGMNHFLLPGQSSDAKSNIRYGAHAMELLINGLLKHGASKDRMIAKVFGGARMFSGTTRIGMSNAKFAQEFLAEEGIAVEAESTGGASARRIRFWPADGRARQLLIPDIVDDPPLKSPPLSRPDPEITLF